MSANFLPKSLHTVRILTAVARATSGATSPQTPGNAVRLILAAARVIGYADAVATDPLIVKAARQLAAGE